MIYRLCQYFLVPVFLVRGESTLPLRQNEIKRQLPVNRDRKPARHSGLINKKTAHEGRRKEKIYTEELNAKSCALLKYLPVQ
jgi:hypothetical protein